MAVLVCIPTNSVRGFPFLHTLSVFIVCRLFDSSHSVWCEMVPHCGFDLHFSGNEWCWASFHVFVSHQNISVLNTFVFPLKSCREEDGSTGNRYFIFSMRRSRFPLGTQAVPGPFIHLIIVAGQGKYKHDPQRISLNALWPWHLSRSPASAWF